MSDSVRPHRQQPTRLCHPWDSPGKNTGVGCHFFLHCVKVKVKVKVEAKVKVKLLSGDRLVATPWNAAHQVPPSMGFSRQEYWSGLPLYTPKQNQNSPTRYSTTYCTGEQMKPKILSVRTKLTKAQTGKQN